MSAPLRLVAADASKGERAGSVCVKAGPEVCPWLPLDGESVPRPLSLQLVKRTRSAQANAAARRQRKMRCARILRGMEAADFADCRRGTTIAASSCMHAFLGLSRIGHYTVMLQRGSQGAPSCGKGMEDVLFRRAPQGSICLFMYVHQVLPLIQQLGKQPKNAPDKETFERLHGKLIKGLYGFRMNGSSGKPTTGVTNTSMLDNVTAH